jgi:hypothetical protein
MELRILHYYHNSDKPLKDVIKSLEAKKLKSGVTVVDIRTDDKYVNVFTNEYHTHSEFIDGKFIKDYDWGPVIKMEPSIWEEGKCLEEEDYSQYLDHPDYWMFKVCVHQPSLDWLTSSTNSLKWQYKVYFFDYDLINEEEHRVDTTCKVSVENYNSEQLI